MMLRVIDYEFLKRSASIETLTIIIVECFVIIKHSLPIRQLAFVIDANINPYLFLFLFSNPHITIFVLLGIIMLTDSLYTSDGNLGISGTMDMAEKKVSLGKLINVYYISFIYVVFLFLIFVIVTIPKVELSLDWGDFTYTLAQTAMIQENNLNMIIPYIDLLKHDPITLFLVMNFIIWQVSVLLCQVSMVLNSLTNSTIGTIIAMGIVLTSIHVMNADGYQWYYFSPVNWINVNTLGVSLYSPFPSIWMSCASLISLNVVLSFGRLRRKHKTVLWRK